MSFSPCLLIPIYNHGHSIRSTVAALVGHALPIFIVDDGSDEATRQLLVQLAGEVPLVRLVRLPQNRGKGAAVMHGMRAARDAGFSHALQIDADGQHDAADVPRFLELAAANPLAFVCGRPIYDASVPKGRLYGRYLTHFWVCVETLNPSVTDSMCGFRIYPLESACALIARVKMPERMDFDIEIFVRLAWAGVDFLFVPTRVVYPENGVSHFRMWHDNLRIAKMHTRLVCGMLVRLPMLLTRKMLGRRVAESRQHWSLLAERGGVLGLRIVFVVYRLLGRRVAGFLLYPIVVYFFLTGRTARSASMAYLRRVHRRSGRAAPTYFDSFRHMLSFAQSGLDKLAAWAGGLGGALVDFPNCSELLRLIDAGQGAVLIGAHLGNLEMMRALAVRERQVAVNAVVYTEHAQRFNAMLRQANAQFGVNLIQVSHVGADTAILLREKIDRGELVVIVGDRTPPGESGSRRVSRVDFLGAPAPFAHGPFILASLLDCPVFLVFSLRERYAGQFRYRVHLESFAERIVLPRRERSAHLQAYIQRYARRLEHHCLQAPEQWFNFYDFWQTVATVEPDKLERSA